MGNSTKLVWTNLSVMIGWGLSSASSPWRRTVRNDRDLSVPGAYDLRCLPRNCWLRGMSTSSKAHACAFAHATMAQTSATGLGRSLAYPVPAGSGLRTVLDVITRTCGVGRCISRNGEARIGDHSSECRAGTHVRVWLVAVAVGMGLVGLFAFFWSSTVASLKTSTARRNGSSIRTGMQRSTTRNVLTGKPSRGLKG